MKSVDTIHYNLEWSPKAKKNLKKHKISFEEAAEVFLDPLHFSMSDFEQPDNDERWITLGYSKAHKLNLVVHTFISYDDDNQVTIRIISARPATKHEKKQYEETK